MQRPTQRPGRGPQKDELAGNGVIGVLAVAHFSAPKRGPRKERGWQEVG